MSWNPKYAILILTSTIITYLSGLLIEKANNSRNEKRKIFLKRLFLTLSLIINLGILFFFKYYNFFANEIALVFF